MSILRSFFSRDLIPLKIASILFLVAIVLGHLTLPLSGILVLGTILSVCGWAFALWGTFLYWWAGIRYAQEMIASGRSR